MSLQGSQEVHVCQKGFWECGKSVHSRRRRAGASAGSPARTGWRGRGGSARGCEVTDRVRAGTAEEGHVWREKGVNTGESGKWLRGCV